MPNNLLLEVKNLSVGYEKKVILSNLDLSISKGEMICLMGPNGSGKSTLLKSLVGILPFLEGEVQINGKRIDKIKQEELSKIVSIVLTHKGDVQGLTVEDVVRLGRFPHTNRFGKLQKSDRNIIKESIETMNLEGIREKLISELSDGQIQKVFIARALAQDTELIILDEPTTYLDIANKMELMSILTSISKEKGKTLLFSSHDWSLALEMCPKAWLLDLSGEISMGTPEEFLFNGTMQKLFMNEKFFLNNSSGRFCELKSTPKDIYLECADSNIKFWSLHALEKIGFKYSEEAELRVRFNDGEFKIEGGKSFSSLSDLLLRLKLS
ncbi:MAG: iron complex transport system ATP-binding protein [Bacteriovoracaceae bacterium]|jgi:iron complex transport system ATP-binding protein